MATRGEIAEPEETTTGHSLSNRERLEIALADAFSVLAKMASLRAKKLSVFAGNARASTQEPNSSSSRDNVPGQLEEQDGAL